MSKHHRLVQLRNIFSAPELIPHKNIQDTQTIVQFPYSGTGVSSYRYHSEGTSDRRLVEQRTRLEKAVRGVVLGVSSPRTLLCRHFDTRRDSSLELEWTIIGAKKLSSEVDR